jgi:hypothetical protein
MQDINDKVLKCLTRLNLNTNECKIISINCEGVGEVNDTGVYILLNGNDVLYVGEANNIARRVGKEHCKARIGASEGVARFLVYLLDKICARRGEWVNYGVVNREKYIVEEVLMPVITKLTILVITCPQLRDIDKKKNKARLKLENCLISKLKPILQM